jgi:DMSO/TMAO reductase YedYZ molybdopterin-dependent catalytic subunit
VQQRLGMLLHTPQARASIAIVSRQSYATEDLFFRVNGYPPVDEAYRDMAKRGFKSWRLQVGGRVERELALSLADLRELPAHVQTTKHTCIQGWTAIASWRGVRLSSLLDLCRPLGSARHVALFAMDDKDETGAPGEEGHGFFYETIPIELARHEQTILAYDFNDRPLTVEHGAPLRLRVENQLGFKMVKWIERIELVDSYEQLGDGRGGWREDNMFYSPAVAI